MYVYYVCIYFYILIYIQSNGVTEWILKGSAGENFRLSQVT